MNSTDSQPQIHSVRLPTSLCLACSLLLSSLEKKVKQILASVTNISSVSGIVHSVKLKKRKKKKSTLPGSVFAASGTSGTGSAGTSGSATSSPCFRWRERVTLGAVTLTLHWPWEAQKYLFLGFFKANILVSFRIQGIIMRYNWTRHMGWILGHPNHL